MAILNWVNAFVNKKLQKNAWSLELAPPAISGNYHPDGRARLFKKKSGRQA